MMSEIKKFEEKKINTLEEKAKWTKGSLVLIWGSSMAGKTTLALNLSRFFEKPLYIKIDKNVPDEQIKGINTGIEIKEASTYSETREIIKSIGKAFDLIIVDSLTGLNEELYQQYRPPRVFNEIAINQNIIMYELNKLKPFVTSFVVTHARIADFETRRLEPNINNRVLKFVDKMMYVYRDEKNKIHVRTFERKLIKTDEFIFE